MNGCNTISCAEAKDVALTSYENETNRGSAEAPFPISSPRSSMSINSQETKSRKKPMGHDKPAFFPKTSNYGVEEEGGASTVVRLNDKEAYWLPPGSLYFRLSRTDMNLSADEQEPSVADTLFASEGNNEIDVQGAASTLSSPQQQGQAGPCVDCEAFRKKRHTFPSVRRPQNNENETKKKQNNHHKNRCTRGRFEIVDDVPVEEPPSMVLASRGATRESRSSIS
jgi:hypothetical protein